MVLAIYIYLLTIGIFIIFNVVHLFITEYVFINYMCYEYFLKSVTCLLIIFMMSFFFLIFFMMSFVRKLKILMTSNLSVFSFYC